MTDGYIYTAPHIRTDLRLTPDPLKPLPIKPAYMPATMIAVDRVDETLAWPDTYSVQVSGPKITSKGNLHKTLRESAHYTETPPRYGTPRLIADLPDWVQAQLKGKAALTAELRARLEETMR